MIVPSLNYSSSKVLVTGAGGFIGSHLCEELLNRGSSVYGVDNFDDYYSPIIKRQNIQNLYNNPRFQFFEADIRSADAMNDLLEQYHVDIVFHLAARAGVRPSLINPSYYADVNVNGTTLLLEQSVKNHVSHFVLASSSSVYGNQTKIPYSEDDDVSKPISPYAATKKACELIAHSFTAAHGLPITCLRYFTVYGPRQRPEMAIAKFTEQIMQGEALQVYGDGNAQRDFTFIDDITAGTLLAGERPNGFEIINLGNSRMTSVNELVKQLEGLCNKKAVVNYLPAQNGDVDKTFADITKAKTQYGYKPNTPIEIGLQKYVQWKLDQNPIAQCF